MYNFTVMTEDRIISSALLHSQRTRI